MNVSPEYIVKTSEKNPDEFKLIEHLPMFYREIFSSFIESKKNILIENLSMTDALLQPIWCNCLFKSKGKTLFLPNWIKSGFRYIRDLYNQNVDLKSSEEILEQLIDRRNWICEFKLLKLVLKHAIDKIKKEMFVMPRINNKYTFNFRTGYYCFLDQKCSFFYKNLLDKKFQSPINQSSLSREFDINKLDRSNIYSCKISSFSDKKISEFNFKLLNNILSTL